ncbi:MAG: phosphate signaling complex protein PhoU [Oscillospiraceae bacterium]|nr:phosphate signaling complex protein PhoU [Oscillospiraceae bacterium]
MRVKFDEQLAMLNDMMIEMGALVEKAINLAIGALEKQDAQLAKDAIAFDNEIDQKEREIEALCLKLLLQQQPVAADLRFISSALKMITDMERIGDQAADISEITKMLTGSLYNGNLEHIPQMAEQAAKMVTLSIDAFVRRDLELARFVIESDDIVDELFVAVRKNWVKRIHDGSADGEIAADMLMVAKYLERIADHAVNIANWVVFSLTGSHV